MSFSIPIERPIPTKKPKSRKDWGQHHSSFRIYHYKNLTRKTSVPHSFSLTRRRHVSLHRGFHSTLWALTSLQSPQGFITHEIHCPRVSLDSTNSGYARAQWNDQSLYVGFHLYTKPRDKDLQTRAASCSAPLLLCLRGSNWGSGQGSGGGFLDFSVALLFTETLAMASDTVTLKRLQR